ncbi:hypothetical protein Tco_0866364 [Tanacetum coccineum]
MGRSPNISFMRPFGCPLTILNTLDHLSKFDGKSEKGYQLGYSTTAKGFESYNRVTRKVQDCLHVNFLENQENQKGKGPDWMFDLDLLTPSMNYIPVKKENYADSKEQGITCDDAEDLDDQQFICHTTQPILMHQESLAKAHNDDQRIAFEEEKRRISIAKGKEHVDSTFTLRKDEEGEDVNVHLYRSMIGCLMYLTASRTRHHVAVFLCARFPSHSKGSSSTSVKRIFSISNINQTGLWRKSNQWQRLVLGNAMKQTIVSLSSTEAEYVASVKLFAQGTITPRTLNFEDEAGPSSPLRPIQVMDSEEQHNAAEVLVAISRPRGLSIPGPIQSQPQQQTQGTDTQGTVPKDKGKGILVEEPKKKKMTLQQIRALETTNDEEVARKIQAEWDAEEERKRFEELKKIKPKTTLRKPTSLAQERNQMMSFLKGQGYKNLQKLKYPQMKELYDKVQAIYQRLTIKDFVPMDSEKEREMLKERDAQRLSRKRKATITEEQPSKKPKLRQTGFISPILEVFFDDYYEHIPPTGLGLALLGDLNIIWETAESSDDDFWKDQEEWEIIRWRFHESSGVHTLEIEVSLKIIHMLAERRYPLQEN